MRQQCAGAIIDEVAVARVWKEVNELSGLKPFKEWLVTTERSIRYAIASSAEHQELTSELFPSRVVFSGPPGCGKTTAATLASQLFHALGVIQKKVVGPVSVGELKLSYLANSAGKVREVLESARNGALIIEEAPVFDDHDHVRMEVLNSFLQAIASAEYSTTLIIFTELNEQFEVFLDAHPIFEMLLPRVPFLTFTPDECAGMLERYMARQSYVINEEVFQHVRELAEYEQIRKGELFANAFWVQRVARQAVDKAMVRSSRDGSSSQILCVDDFSPM